MRYGFFTKGISLRSFHKRPYVKTFITYEEQVELLASRGLAFNDRVEATRFLSYVNYYRFSGYAFIFKDIKTNVYRSDVSFEDVVALYRFDQALRTLVSEEIALIEIYARTKIAYFIGKKYGPFGHTNDANFPNESEFKKWLATVQKEAEVSATNDKPFGVAATQHFRDHYTEWPNLPIWLLTEILSFGKLKKLFSLLQKSDQIEIAGNFGLKSGKLLNSWFNSLNATRNVCAHFERLWNRSLQIAPIIPNDREWNFVRNNERKIFTIFTIIKHILDVIKTETSVNSDWKDRLCRIMDARPCGSVFNDKFYYEQMGFVPDWENQDIWKRQ